MDVIGVQGRHPVHRHEGVAQVAEAGPVGGVVEAVAAHARRHRERRLARARGAHPRGVVLDPVAVAVLVAVVLVAALVDAVVPDHHRRGVGVAARVGVVAVAGLQPARARHIGRLQPGVGPRNVAVAVLVVVVLAAAVGVLAVVPLVRRRGVDRVDEVVAVPGRQRPGALDVRGGAAGVLVGDVAVAVLVVVVFAAAVGVHPVVPGVRRRRVDRGDQVVAVPAGQPAGLLDPGRGREAIGVGVVVVVAGAVLVVPVIPGLGRAREEVRAAQPAAGRPLRRVPAVPIGDGVAVPVLVHIGPLAGAGTEQGGKQGEVGGQPGHGGSRARFEGSGSRGGSASHGRPTERGLSGRRPRGRPPGGTKP